ncbi:bifunctional metallophosphatase/5'-nucleotidase [Streptomyces sp. ISL-43]|uniref:metallophosphoesterase n=1 Tax=Streptomyces sp. ISL-43 TaxID=2819183 RepID=UPI001BE9B3DD|nr:metallophosphoesterase [Streptomyces sp. ISL-43]MBT2451062.1 bifunctional metallophosphatase/5'-nucleotidase [Streptomyces sp. ISL-43]
MTTARSLRQIMATTDVHSALGANGPLLGHLHQARTDSLLVDCGDFFEGTGYYRLGRGALERDILLALYDVVAPGNHGWPHYFEPSLHQRTVCANVVEDSTGNALFRRLRIVDVAGRRTAVTAVIGAQAFNSIPAGQRSAHRVTDPVQALRELMLAHHHEVDSWVLLSHSGFEQDLQLAEACPFLDVVFAGHCHSEHTGPERVGGTIVLKGHELAVGYAVANRSPEGWVGRTARFPDTSQSVLPTELDSVREQIASIDAQLAEPLGRLVAPYRNNPLDRRALLRELADRLRNGLGSEAVVLNETAVRTTLLGEVLTTGDLLAIEPFDNKLVEAQVAPAFRNDPAALLTHLSERAGPLVTSSDPLPGGMTSVLTTDYLADTCLGSRAHPAGLSLGSAIRSILTNGDDQ